MAPDLHMASPASRKLEYKYVILRAGDIGEWQPGANLMVDVPSETATLYVDDRWLGEDRSLRVESEPADSSKTATPPVVTPKLPQESTCRIALLSHTLCFDHEDLSKRSLPGQGMCLRSGFGE